MYEKLLEEKPALTIKDLAVNGKDLMEIGIPAGPKLGGTLKALLDLVLEDPARNTREELLREAGQMEIS